MTADYFAPVVGRSGLRAGPARRRRGRASTARSTPSRRIEDALGSALFASGPLHDGADRHRRRGYARRDAGAGAGLRRARLPAGQRDPGADRRRRRGGAERGRQPRRRAAPAAEPPARPDRAARARAADREAATRPESGWAGSARRSPTRPPRPRSTSPPTRCSRRGSGIVARALGSRKATVSRQVRDLPRPRRLPGHHLGRRRRGRRGRWSAQAIADAAKPMAPPAFAAARAGFVYRLLASMETPGRPGRHLRLVRRRGRLPRTRRPRAATAGATSAWPPR